MLLIAVFLTAAFLIGSIPFGYIVAKRMSGINIQTVGSGNIGSTNVGRFIGRRAELITQALDIAKGLVPTTAALVTVHYQYASLGDSFPLAAALAAICGHNFTPWLKFRGGKGVNTTLGATLMLAPLSTLLSIAVYFIVVRISRYIALGSIGIGISLPLFCWMEKGSGATLIYAAIAGTLIFLRHIGNIQRIISGIEDRKE